MPLKASAKIIFPLICGCLVLSAVAMAGQAGEVYCTAPGCGYRTNLTIGGGMKSPAITGYCAKENKFVRLKLQSWADYRKPHKCPGSKERLQPIYDGADVARIPCLKCGHLTLQYKRGLLFD